jgi:hypothetical protein
MFTGIIQREGKAGAIYSVLSSTDFLTPLRMNYSTLSRLRL